MYADAVLMLLAEPFVNNYINDQLDIELKMHY